jgi:hypothetical protein
VSLPIAAREAGTASNAAPGEIGTLVNRPVGVTVTNPTSALGTNREDKVLYRARCRSQAIATSPNGPSDAYLRLANTNPDGTLLLRGVDFGGDGLTPVGITRAQVSASSTTGQVAVRYADDDGAADAVDVATAVDNTERFGVPSTVTYAGAAATNVTVPVTYTIKALTASGLTDPQIKALALTALQDLFKATEIAGYDKVAGAGTLYADLIKATITASGPSYTTTLTLPAGNVALAFGEVAVLGTVTGTVVLT